MVKQAATVAAPKRVKGKCGRWTLAVAATVVVVAAPSAGLAEGMPKSQWFGQMEKALPNNFCAQQQYFRQCFEVDAKTCKSTLASATRECIGQIESDVPDELDGQSRQKWGERLGQCAGQTYETNLADKRIDSERCNDPDNWL